MTPGGRAEMHQLSWHRVDSNGLGAKTERKFGRHPQAVNIISCSFLISSDLFTLCLIYTYVHIY